MPSAFRLLVLLGIVASSGWAAEWEPNYDESQVPDFVLPELLTSFDGTPIDSVAAWREQRRPELRRYLAENMYGVAPSALPELSAKVIEQSDDAFDGLARRRQIQITLHHEGRTLAFNLLLYLPQSPRQAPVFLALNFYGNHTISDDPAVLISSAWSRNSPDYHITDHRLTEASRGCRAHRWDLPQILAGGIGLATVYYGEIDPDKPDFSDGVHALYQTTPAAGEWNSIAAWAWGMSRVMDFLQTYDEVASDRVIAFGHSRLGKTSLWAGAIDERYAGVISNDSGCGGAALSKRRFGETLWKMHDAMPHWLCANNERFIDHEEDLPVDQHAVLALVAPRPLYIASATEDLWADPRGEYLSAYHASQVWSLYGLVPLPSAEPPPPNHAIHGAVSYHLRTGGHDVTPYDWGNYIAWAHSVVFHD